MSSPSSSLERAIAFAPTPAGLEAALEILERAAPGSSAATLRREALARYAEVPAPPGSSARGWRHNYADLPFEGLRWSSERVAIDDRPNRTETASAEDGEGFWSGGLFHLGSTYFAPRRTDRVDPRIIVVPLDDAAHERPDLVGPLRGTIVDWRTDKFAALATAFENCGAFVYVPDGVVLEAPILLAWAGRDRNDPEAVFPHVVVALGAGARATVVEQIVGHGDGLACGIVEVHVGPGAQLDYVALQSADEGTRLLMRRGAACEAGATVRWHLADLGGALARDVVDARLAAPDARAEISALFFNTGWQHVDLATTVEHASPRTSSTTVVRSAATDRGQGRYLGNIAILAGAHGTDASLRDDALLLSSNAHIDSIPALEIAANDVKAFHGATIGSLDEDEIFYVQSRGIARPEAIRMVALGFFEPAIARFPSERLREQIRVALDAKIDAATEQPE
ncbi:MAG: Fe-S cluster assembly protein SufD [Candidatus Baltobacteraceae bacterium]